MVKMSLSLPVLV